MAILRLRKHKEVLKVQSLSSATTLWDVPASRCALHMLNAPGVERRSHRKIPVPWAGGSAGSVSMAATPGTCLHGGSDYSRTAERLYI